MPWQLAEWIYLFIYESFQLMSILFQVTKMFFILVSILVLVNYNNPGWNEHQPRIIIV